jgi:serine/threonine protein kinase
MSASMSAIPQTNEPTVTSSRNPTSRPQPSSALNFLVAVATSDVAIYSSSELRLEHFRVETAGSGGYATVEVGRSRSKQTVAIKHNRILAQPLRVPQQSHYETFHNHLQHLCLELRILSHGQLRKHPNILDIHGVCIDSYSGLSSLSLVLEYSSLGNLKEFLRKNPDLSTAANLGLAFQCAKGIEALHELKICHGDVKTQNVLVFQESAGWTAKISDFGQSVVANKDDLTATVPVPAGTPLYEAPEISSDMARVDPAFDIEAAMRTDVYSFGLLVWEVLNHGNRYYAEQLSEVSYVTVGTSSIEQSLVDVSADRMYKKALQFLQRSDLKTVDQIRISLVFEGTLRAEPHKRKAMSILVKELHPTDCSTE